MAQRFLGSVVVSVMGLAIGAAVACGGGQKGADSANDQSGGQQPTEDQLWPIADMMATHAPQATDQDLDQIPGANGPDDGGAAPPAQATNAPPMPAGWVTLTSQPCGFSINMPANAPDDPNTGDATHQYRYAIPGDPDGAYVVSCTLFNKPNANVKAWLDDATKKVAGKGNITAQSDITVGNATGRELHIDLPGSAGKAVARILWDKDRSIVAIVGMEDKLWNDGDANAFLQSLQLNQ